MLVGKYLEVLKRKFQFPSGATAASAISVGMSAYNDTPWAVKYFQPTVGFIRRVQSQLERSRNTSNAVLDLHIGTLSQIGSAICQSPAMVLSLQATLRLATAIRVSSGHDPLLIL